eukprot:TRINITY_DN4526_c1_g2_i4.p2 TRINITY_DN4526_c1_g2~~TRINITY_DN4526_c1_g2_i4.p2  ORF type:complete len:348 (+),score=71.83 TRINITY_DN4526_c1_g2_i4:152-1045(+)
MYVDKLLKSTREELLLETDYTNEAKNQNTFKNLTDTLPHNFGSRLRVPEVISHLSTKRVFVSRLIRGVPVDKLASAVEEGTDAAAAALLTSFDQTARNNVSASLLHLCLLELFSWKRMQTDPNWSNFFYEPPSTHSNKDPGTLHLLDFGACRTFSDEFTVNYFSTIQAAVHGDMEGVLRHSRAVGFLTGEESPSMNNAHCAAVMTLADPFRSPPGTLFDFAKADITKRVTPHIPLMVRQRLRPPPEEVYSLHRKLAGTFLICARLGAKIDTGAMWRDIERAMTTTMDATQQNIRPGQ